MTTCADIDRLISTRSSTVKEALDLAVRKTSDTQRALDRFRSYALSDNRSSNKYQRVSDNFSKVSAKLESAIKRYQETLAIKVSTAGTQLDVISSAGATFSKPSSSYAPGGSYDYISSMEEGSRSLTLQDLSRINKEMNSLQDIYVSLSDVARNQESVLDSVQDKLGSVARSASSAVQELNKAKDRLDYWTRIKLYTVSGAAAVGFVIWLL
jgi:t-SNARE complex subunit (syntaxin)